MKTIFIVFNLMFVAFLAHADILNVPESFSSIQQAIDAAEPGDTVLVAENTYYENINFKGKAITVASHYVLEQDTSYISKTIIDGSQPSNPDSGSVVYIISGEDTTSVLCGFTITGGTGTPMLAGGERLARAGGGINIENAGAKICHNYIYNNSVADSFVVIGGGLTAGPPEYGGLIIIENNIFDSNSCLRSVFASNGGGMTIVTPARVCNNVFSNNIVSSDSGEAFGGGFLAAYNLDFMRVYNNVIINNKAETFFTTNPDLDAALGGGFMIWNDMTSNVRMYGNIIANNEVSGSNWTTGAGGCFEDVAGDVIFSNNLVYDNFYSGTVDCHGTGISVLDHTVITIINNTITGNQASPYGGALATWKTISTSAMNNIFWGNSSGTSKPEVAVWEEPAPDIFYSDIQGGWEGEGNIDVNPMFTDTQFHLSDSSRCIGRGNTSYSFAETILYSPEYDFEGNIRPSPGSRNPDIGAQENERAYPLLSVIQIPEDYETIQAGVDEADDGDTVLVAEGIYYENVQIEKKAVTLASYFLIDGDTSHISRTIINGSQPANTDNASVIMILNTQEPNTICGFTLTGGTGRNKVFPNGYTQIGGGIYIEESSAIIKNNYIINNSIISAPQALGTMGGGIFWGAEVTSGLTLEISGNLISGNEISAIFSGGGGICISNVFMGGELNYLVEDNIIENNMLINTDDWKAMGGGIYIDSYLPTIGIQTIRNNIIRNNQAICNVPSKHSFGGGIYIVFVESILDGAVDNNPGPYINNNIISGNYSDYLGGGVSVWRVYEPTPGSLFTPLRSAGHYTPKPSFVNNTIVDNTAQDGSGFYIMNHKPFLMNNILWNKYPDGADWGEIFLGDEPQWTEWVEGNRYGDVKINYTDIQGSWDDGVGNFNSNPLFSDTINYNLSDESPCIDAGHADSIFHDISGYRGIATWPAMGSSRNDMGAYGGPYEYNYEDLAEIIIATDIHKFDSELPRIFHLSQNYPNPFNPLTVISWQLAVASQVDLSIYNILGQKVVTLISEKQPAGKYKVDWDATGFASGIYLYKFSTDKGYVKTKKLILLK